MRIIAWFRSPSLFHWRNRDTNSLAGWVQRCAESLSPSKDSRSRRFFYIFSGILEVAVSARISNDEISMYFEVYNLCLHTRYQLRKPRSRLLYYCCRRDIQTFITEHCCDRPYHHINCSGENIILQGVDSFPLFFPCHDTENCCDRPYDVSSYILFCCGLITGRS